MSTRFSPTFSCLARNLALLGFAVLAAFCFPRTSTGQAWKPLGPAGGDVRALAVAPSDPSIVYLGTTDGHIFISRDAGEHWSLAGRAGFNAVITAVVVDPRDSQKLIASAWTKEASGEAGGIYRSADAGKTWRESGLAGHAVRALVAAPLNPRIFVAGALDGVFRSLDGAESWQRISPENDPEIRNLDSLAMDPKYPEIIYAGTFHLPWKTSDGGETWAPIHRGMIDDSDVLSVFVDPADSSRVLASACSGIYLSDDAGNLWQKLHGIPYSSRRTQVVRTDPADPEIFYAGTTEGLWKSSNRGGSWERISPADWVVNTLTFAPDSGESRDSARAGESERLLIGTEQEGVLISDDAGRNFRAANDGFYHRQLLSLAEDPAENRHIAAVVADAPLPVVESSDGGETWLPLGQADEISDAQRVFWTPAGWRVTLASGGLARWDSARRIWARAGKWQESPARVDSARRPEALAESSRPLLSVVSDLAFSESEWFAATADGVLVSEDRGETWTVLSAPPFGLPADSIRTSREGRKLRAVSSGGMIFSDDGGRTSYWRDLPFGSGGVQRIEFADASTILATSRTGLYISRDGGASWSRAQSGLPAAPVAELLLRGESWLVETAAGDFYLSRDRGLNWERLGKIGSDDFDIKTLENPARPGDKPIGSIYAPSGNDGLFMLELQPTPATASLIASGKRVLP